METPRKWGKESPDPIVLLQNGTAPATSQSCDKGTVLRRSDGGNYRFVSFEITQPNSLDLLKQIQRLIMKQQTCEIPPLFRIHVAFLAWLDLAPKTAVLVEISWDIVPSKPPTIGDQLAQLFSVVVFPADGKKKRGTSYTSISSELKSWAAVQINGSEKGWETWQAPAHPPPASRERWADVG